MNNKTTAGESSKRWFVLLLLYLSASISLRAQQSNLFEVLQAGKENYPLLKAKQYEVNSARQKVNAVSTEYLPGITVADQYTYSTSNNVEGSFFPYEGTAFAPSGGIRPNSINHGVFGSFTSAILDWKIINFGKLSATINTAKAEGTRAELDYENELFQHQIRIADTYLMLLIAHQLTEVQRYNLQRAIDFKSIVDANVIAGLKPGVDSSIAHSELAKAQLLLMDSEKNENSYRLRLGELTGGGKDSLSADTMSFFQSLPAALEFDRNNLNNAPVLRFYQSLMNVSNTRSISIKRSFYPSLSIVGALWARGSGISRFDNSYRTDFASGINYQVFNYMAGIALKWNLTSYFRIRKEYKSEVFQKDRFQELYNTQLLKQSRELKEADMQFSVSLRQAQLAPVQLNAARAAFEQASTRYENGLTDLPTYTQSMLALNRAEADCCICYSNAWRSLLMKAAAAGDLSLFLNQVK